MAAWTEPGALIELASLPNRRDIGGYPARGGRVEMGLLLTWDFETKAELGGTPETHEVAKLPAAVS